MKIELNDDEIKNVLYVGTLLMSNLSSLINNYYQCIGSSFENSSASEGKRYNFEFKSTKANRIISISYSPPTNITTLHCFNVSVETADDILYLNDLISDHKLFNGINYLNLKNYEGDTKQKIKKFVHFLDTVFTENFPEIISGKKWEHIGIDWHGYK